MLPGGCRTLSLNMALVAVTVTPRAVPVVGNRFIPERPSCCQEGALAMIPIGMTGGGHRFGSSTSTTFVIFIIPGVNLKKIKNLSIFLGTIRILQRSPV